MSNKLPEGFEFNEQGLVVTRRVQGLNMSKYIDKVCMIDGCRGYGKPGYKGRRYLQKGLCTKHYTRLYIYGDVDSVNRMYGENRHQNPLYKTYRNMKSRCYNQRDKSYENYGGRGIKVCDRWLGIYGFSNFCRDIGKRPKGLSLDRKDNDRDYSPDNCRWATFMQQMSNKSSNNIVVGVSYYKPTGKYRAYITVNKIRYTLGHHATLTEATRARREAEMMI